MSWIKLKSTLIKPDLFYLFFFYVKKLLEEWARCYFTILGFFFFLFISFILKWKMWLNVSKQQQKNRKETKKKKESTSCVSEAKNSRSEKRHKIKKTSEATLLPISELRSLPARRWRLCQLKRVSFFYFPFLFCRCVVLFMARVLKSVSSFKISDCFSLWYWPKSSTTPSIEHAVIPTIGQNTAFVGIEG